MPRMQAKFETYTHEPMDVNRVLLDVTAHLDVKIDDTRTAAS